MNMRRMHTPASSQETFLFPRPTIEERISHVSEKHKDLARAVEEERAAVRDHTLEDLKTHGSVQMQDKASNLLWVLETIDPIELAFELKDLHYPKEQRWYRTPGFIALGKIHRALEEFEKDRPQVTLNRTKKFMQSRETEPIHVSSIMQLWTKGRDAIATLVHINARSEASRGETYDPLR